MAQMVFLTLAHAATDDDKNYSIWWRNTQHPNVTDTCLFSKIFKRNVFAENKSYLIISLNGKRNDPNGVFDISACCHRRRQKLFNLMKKHATPKCNRHMASF